MTLKDLNLKTTYDPSKTNDDLVNEFYIPCLRVSNRYDRCSAYFSSEVLKQFSKGLVDFFKNNGHARFIFSCQIDESEMNQIIYGYEQKMNAMADMLEDELLNDYQVANLSYLIKTNKVEVKIAFMIANRASLMHIKLGLFEDKEGNKIYFDGSGNETKSGINSNAEIFHIYRNNNEFENRYVIDGETIFNELWNNTYNKDLIRTEFPTGKLFNKLLFYNQNRLFNSKEDFFDFNDCVFIDINKEINAIVLEDFTKEKRLSSKRTLGIFLNNRFKKTNENKYLIEKIDVYTLDKLIKDKLDRLSIKYIYSSEALQYVKKNKLELEKRIKLGESIKTNQNRDLWESDYNYFKYLVSLNSKCVFQEEQLLGAFYHLKMKSSMDFSVPGTGKTYISYALFLYLLAKQYVDKIVVIGPYNSFKAWIDERNNIFLKEMKVFDIRDYKVSELNKNLINDNSDIYLINYEFFNDERNLKFEALKDYVFDNKTLLILDEVHKLKNIKGKRSKNFIKLLSSCHEKPIYKLLLTGTPIPNSYSDLYNYIRILYGQDEGELLYIFNEQYLKRGDDDLNIQARINNTLHPLFFRITKKDLKVPLANPDDLVTLSSYSSEVEDNLYRLIYLKYKNPLVKFIRLIQASSNPKLIKEKINIEELNEFSDYSFESYNFNEEINSSYDNEIEECVNQISLSSKTRKTIDFIEQKCKEHKKVIVWCLFISTMELVYNELNKRNIKSIIISGSDSNSKIRDSKIDSFKYGSYQVLITNPNTLAESVSLHLWCHDAVYLEFGFNLTYMLQSKDRINRVGLKEDEETNYYYAIAQSNNIFEPIDLRIYNRLKEKEKRMLDAIESNKMILFKDSSDLEDIKYILENK